MYSPRAHGAVRLITNYWVYAWTSRFVIAFIKPLWRVVPLVLVKQLIRYSVHSQNKLKNRVQLINRYYIKTFNITYIKSQFRHKAIQTRSICEARVSHSLPCLSLPPPLIRGQSETLMVRSRFFISRLIWNYNSLRRNQIKIPFKLGISIFVC